MIQDHAAARGRTDLPCIVTQIASCLRLGCTGPLLEPQPCFPNLAEPIQTGGRLQETVPPSWTISSRDPTAAFGEAVSPQAGSVRAGADGHSASEGVGLIARALSQVNMLVIATERHQSLKESHVASYNVLMNRSYFL